MATQTYRRRRRAFEGDEGRTQAIKRIQDEHSIREKINQLNKRTGPGREERNNQQKGRAFQTTRGRRRLSFQEAYSHRTTDTSRARVLALYGRSKPPTTPRPGDNASRRISTPVRRGTMRLPNEGRSTGGARYPAGGDQGAGLNRVAQMRSKLRGNMDYLPRRKRRTRPLGPTSRSPVAGPKTKYRFL